MVCVYAGVATAVLLAVKELSRLPEGIAALKSAGDTFIYHKLPLCKPRMQACSPDQFCLIAEIASFMSCSGQLGTWRALFFP